MIATPDASLPVLVGWAILHSLWLGLLVVAVLWPCLRHANGRRPRVAVALASMAMLGLAAGFVAALGCPPDGTLPDGGLGARLGLDGTGNATVGRTLDEIAPILAFGWLLGASWITLSWLRAHLRVRRWLRRGRPVTAAQLLGSHAWPGLARIPLRLVRKGPPGPCVAGVRRPVILVPLASLRCLDRRGLAAILAHEEGHVLRRDPWTYVALRILRTLLFFHPASWWLDRCVYREREHCCDDLAVSRCGDARVYARALASLAVPGVQRSVLAARSADLLPRLTRLLRPGSHGPRQLPGITLALLGTALSVAAGLLLADLHVRAVRARSLADRPWVQVLGASPPLLLVAPGVAAANLAPPAGDMGFLVALGRGAQVRQGDRVLPSGTHVHGGESLHVELAPHRHLQLAIDREDAEGDRGSHDTLQLKVRRQDGGWQRFRMREGFAGHSR